MILFKLLATLAVGLMIIPHTDNLDGPGLVISGLLAFFVIMGIWL